MPRKLYKYAPADVLGSAEKKDKRRSYTSNAEFTPSLKNANQETKPIPPPPSLSRHYFQQYSHARNILNYLEQHIAGGDYQLTSPPKVCDPAEKTLHEYHQDHIAMDKSGTLNNQRKKNRPYSAPRRLMAKRKANSSFHNENIAPSLELRNVITMQYFPEFISLRKSYLLQLNQLSLKILELNDETEREREIPKFLLLIQSLRQLSLKMIKVYQKAIEEQSSSSYELWDEYTDCLKTIPSTFDFLDRQPFRSYTGLFLSCNPFASTYDLLGELAINTQLLPDHVMSKVSNKAEYEENIIRALPKALRFDEEEFLSFQHMTLILRDICSQANDQSSGKSENADHSRQSALTFLLFQPSSLAALEEQCKLVTALANKYAVKRCIGLWFTRYKAFQSVYQHERERTLALVTRSFRHFMLIYHHRKGMRKLIREAQRQELTKAMRKWKAVIHWWQSYYDIFIANRRYRMAVHYLLAWKRMVKTGDINLIAIQEQNYAFALEYQEPTIVEKVQQYVARSSKVIASGKQWIANTYSAKSFLSPRSSRPDSPSKYLYQALCGMTKSFQHQFLLNKFKQWQRSTTEYDAIESSSSFSFSSNSDQKIVRQYSGNVITKWFRMFDLLPEPTAKVYPIDKPSLTKSQSLRSMSKAFSFRSVAQSASHLPDEDWDANSFAYASNSSDTMSYQFIS